MDMILWKQPSTESGFRFGRVISAMTLVVAVSLVAGLTFGGPVVFEIGSHRQLFLDDHLLDAARAQRVTPTLNPPQSIRRVLKPDQPWEALGFIFYASVVDDGKTIQLYHGSYDAEKKKHFLLATSTDGFHWEQPELGLKKFQGSTKNNILPLDAVEVSVIRDSHSPPEKRYRLLFTSHWPDPARAGVYAASSADGIAWNVTPERMLPFVPDSQPSFFWDESLQKYSIYLRAWNPHLRAVSRMAVDDLEKPWPYDSSVPPYFVWGKDKIPTFSREWPIVMGPDEKDPPFGQLYTSVAMRYPYAPHIYVAFPAVFLNFRAPEWKERAVSSSDGTFDVQLATSIDGITWKRWHQPYVSGGLQDGLDLRLVSMGTGMVRRGNLLLQYFVGWPHTHGLPGVWDRDPATRAPWLKKDLGGIYCATQRLDGFVSMDAGDESGTITTVPLVFKGDRLLLNLHVAGTGIAKVAILDQKGDALPGFSTDDCSAMNEDAVNLEVHWKEGVSLSALAGKPVRLQFMLRNAKLYAFQFIPAKDPASK